MRCLGANFRILSFNEIKQLVKQKKIMYVVSLFSGLETSMRERCWKPTGVPTIYKIIDKLDQGPDSLHLVFTCKNEQSTWKQAKDQTFSIKGLQAKVRVLAGNESIPSGFGRLRSGLKEIRQIWKLWQLYRQIKPDLIYFDRANLWAAGLFARLCDVKIVFRVMGVKYDMLESLTGKCPRHYIMRWAYRAPFAAVICTEDGSGSEQWAKRALNPKVVRKILINGVDLKISPQEIDPRLLALPQNQTIVLFLGKLEKVKGCDSFVKGFLQALEQERQGLHALIIGAGYLEKEIRELVGKKQAENCVTFIDRLMHEQVIKAHQLSDIYVSLNRLGNLSNANLEAMKSGSCMIFPNSQPELGIDLVVDQMIPNSAVMRVPHADDIPSICEAILILHRNPSKRKKMAEKMEQVANRFIPGWEKRLNEELELLQNL